MVAGDLLTIVQGLRRQVWRQVGRCGRSQEVHDSLKLERAKLLE